MDGNRPLFILRPHPSFGVNPPRCAYNSVRGKPACLSPLLKSAREQWNFTGYVTSDSDAVADAYQTHHYVKTGEEATCGALTAGQCDMNSGQTFLKFLNSAVSQGRRQTGPRLS
jgi:beta-glucosidase